MNDKEALLTYRMTQAQETLAEAQKMLQNNFSPRSIVNRTYYSMFYVLLALFLKTDISIKTSKHTAVISIFDREFVHKGIISKQYSKTLHKIFGARQLGDYREFVQISSADAAEYVKLAEDFFEEIKKLIIEH
ncbi:MAG: HEPN domain-containing protein [bacterium]|jgi:uncharacterized protein (UPF0332 family)